MIESNASSIVLLRTEMLRQLNHAEALFISQLDYWLDRCGHLAEGHYWVRNTAREWSLQLGLSERQLARTIDHLIELGIIERAHVNRHSYDRTWSYRLCYEQLTAVTGLPARYAPRGGIARFISPNTRAQQPARQVSTRVLYQEPPAHVNTARIGSDTRPRTATERAACRDYVASLENHYAAEREARPVVAPDFSNSQLFAHLPPAAQRVFTHCAAQTASAASEPTDV